MKLSAPTRLLWSIAFMFGIAGIIGHFLTIPYFTEYKFTLLLIGFVLLVIGTTFKRA